MEGWSENAMEEKKRKVRLGNTEEWGERWRTQVIVCLDLLHMHKDCGVAFHISL